AISQCNDRGVEGPQPGRIAPPLASLTWPVGFGLRVGRLVPESKITMQELHSLEPWKSAHSTEDFQGHFVFGNGRTIAATITEDACEVTAEDLANCSLIVAAPAMLKALRQIAREADFLHEDGAMELGERLMWID